MSQDDYLSSEQFLLNRTHDILNSKWKVYLIYTLGRHVYRFGDLKRTFHHISRLSLTKYLQELERDGLVCRQEYPAPPLKTEYSLTDLGLSVYPHITALVDWGRL